MLCRDWKLTQTHPHDSMMRRFFHTDIEDFAGDIPDYLPESLDFASMPYMFWNQMLLYSKNEDAERYILCNMPPKYLHTHFAYLKRRKHEGFDDEVRAHLHYISLREDAYKGMPEEWLHELYL